MLNNIVFAGDRFTTDDCRIRQELVEDLVCRETTCLIDGTMILNLNGLGPPGGGVFFEW
jgi:hypothetical protein